MLVLPDEPDFAREYHWTAAVDQKIETSAQFLFISVNVSGLFLVRIGKHGEERKRSQRLFVGGASTA